MIALSKKLNAAAIMPTTIILAHNNLTSGICMDYLDILV